MADAWTGISALGLYYTGVEGASDFGSQSGSIGGARTARMMDSITALYSTPIPPLAIEAIYGPAGIGYINVIDEDTITYTAPTDDEGPEVEIASGETKLVPSDNANFGVIVTREAEYSGDDIGGRMELDCRKSTNNALAMSNVSAADAASGQDYYRCVPIHNHTDAAIDTISVSVRTWGTQKTSSAGQLGASGAGAITVGSAFSDDTPDIGWALIRTAADAIREIVYYSERTDTELTVPATGRGLLGTSAAAGAIDDKIDFIPGIRIAVIAPGSDGKFEEISDENTAPSAVTWKTAGETSSITSIGAGDSYGLWIHREIPPDCVAGRYESKIRIAWDTYQQDHKGYYWASDGTEVYGLAVAEGEMPTDLVDADSSLPLTYALTPPVSGTTEYWGVAILRNQYGLTSQNKYPTKITINSAGEEAGSELAVPTDVELLTLTGGYLMLRAKYAVTLDATPATAFRAYVTTDGDDPDIAVDTPTAYTMTTNPNGPQYQLEQVIGPYDYGVTVKAVVTAYKSATPAKESDASAVASNMISTVSPVDVAGDIFLGFTGAMKSDDPIVNTVTIYDSPTNSVGARIIPGEAHLFINDETFLRAVWSHEDHATIYLHDDWSLVYGSVSGAAGVADVPLDPASSTLAYIAVNGQRVVELNQGTQTITYSGDLIFGGVEPTADLTPEVAHMTDTETLFLVPDPNTGKYRTWMSVDENGNITISRNVRQDVG